MLFNNTGKFDLRPAWWRWSASDEDVTPWPLRMGPIHCPETSVKNYHYTLRNILGERSSHSTRSASSRNVLRDDAPSRNASCYQELRAVMALTQTTEKLQRSKSEGRVRTVADTNNWPDLPPVTSNDSAEMLVMSERPQVGSWDPLRYDCYSYYMTDCGCLKQHSHFHWNKSPDLAFLLIFCWPRIM